MADRSFDLEMILAEAAVMKKQRQQAENASPPPPETAERIPQPLPKEPQPDAPAPKKNAPVPVKEVPSSSEDLPKENVIAFAEQVKTAAPAEPENAAASAEPEERTLPPTEMTRVVELPDRHRKKAVKAPESAALDGQMDWVSLGVEEPPEPPMDEDALRQQLKEVRAEKVREFRLSGMEEEITPEEEIVEPESPAMEEYESYEESETVRNDLEYHRSTALISFLLSLLFEGVLLVLALVTQLAGHPPFETVIFLLANAGLLLLMMVFNHRLVGGGLAGVLRGRADTASAASIACVPVLIHTFAQLSHMTASHMGDGVLTAAAGLCLLSGSLGRYLRIARVTDNFRFASYEVEKTAVELVSNPVAAVQIGRTAVAEGVPRVAHPRPATFLTGFLEHSYADDALDRQMKRLVPMGLVLALLPAVVFGFWKGDWWLAFSAFCVTVCLLFSCCSLLSAAAMLHRSAKRALRAGAMITGFEAVETYGDIDAVTVQAEELFPPDSLMLHGIKTFKGARIDEAIMDAAAVSIAEGGPLAAVFRRIITDRVDILQPVDSLVYEQDMGVSGWVGGRRVLVGNRRLLQNHGVDVPSNAYEERYATDGRKLVYLSTAGELSAMFVVSYLADEEISRALRGFARCDIDLLVHSCDPNITEALVCETLGLDDYHVAIMDAQAARAFVGLAPKPDERPAVLATDGRLPGLVEALGGCNRLRRAFALSRVLQWVGMFAGLVLSMTLLFVTGMVLPPLFACGFICVGILIGWLLPLLCC